MGMRNTAVLAAALAAFSEASTAQVSDPALVAASLFDTYCLSKVSDFETLGQRATDAHYEVYLERSIPLPNGSVMKQKNWIVPSSSPSVAPLMLNSTDGMSVDGDQRVFGCSVFGPDLKPEALESALTNLPRLGTPVKHAQVPSGGNVVTWLARVGDLAPSEDSEVLMSRDTPGMPGVGVFLIFKTHLQKPAQK